MNKRSFRLIFSKPLGFLIPVAEIATAQRKPGQQQTISHVSLPVIAPAFSFKRLVLSLLFAGVPSWADAEILLDRSGGASVSSAANGVPVIEIAKRNLETQPNSSAESLAILPPKRRMIERYLAEQSVVTPPTVEAAIAKSADEGSSQPLGPFAQRPVAEIAAQPEPIPGAPMASGERTSHHAVEAVSGPSGLPLSDLESNRDPMQSPLSRHDSLDVGPIGDSPVARPINVKPSELPAAGLISAGAQEAGTAGNVQGPDTPRVQSLMVDAPMVSAERTSWREEGGHSELPHQKRVDVGFAATEQPAMPTSQDDARPIRMPVTAMYEHWVNQPNSSKRLSVFSNWVVANGGSEVEAAQVWNMSKTFKTAAIKNVAREYNEAREAGRPYPSPIRLAEQLGVPLSTVQGAIKSLKDLKSTQLRDPGADPVLATKPKPELIKLWKKTAQNPDDKADFLRYLDRIGANYMGQGPAWNEYQAYRKGEKVDPAAVAQVYKEMRETGQATEGVRAFAARMGTTNRQLVAELSVLGLFEPQRIASNQVAEAFLGLPREQQARERVRGFAERHGISADTLRSAIHRLTKKEAAAARIAPPLVNTRLSSDSSFLHLDANAALPLSPELNIPSPADLIPGLTSRAVSEPLSEAHSKRVPIESTPSRHGLETGHPASVDSKSGDQADRFPGSSQNDLLANHEVRHVVTPTDELSPGIVDSGLKVTGLEGPVNDPVLVQPELAIVSGQDGNASALSPLPLITAPVEDVDLISDSFVAPTIKVEPSESSAAEFVNALAPQADISGDVSGLGSPAAQPLPLDASVKAEVPVIQHTINNAGPVLQGENGEDVLHDVLTRELRVKKTSELAVLVDRLKTTFSGELLDGLFADFRDGRGSDLGKIRAVQDHIAAAAKNLLKMTNEARAEHLDSLMGVEEVPGLGRGVVAKRDIKAYEVLGPYSGKFLDGAAQKSAEEQRIGRDKLFSYAFELPNKNAIISGFGEGHGNVTTLLNDAESARHNNVDHFWLGKNVVFYVTKRPVKQGEQLLLNYGEVYDRSGWESHPIVVDDAGFASGATSGADGGVARAPKAKQVFDQHVIVNTDPNNPVVNEAAQNLASKHPDTSVVIGPIVDGGHKVLSGNLAASGTKKVQVVGHADGMKLGGLDGKQITDVVQKLASDSNSSVDKLVLVGCGTACAKGGSSLVTEVSGLLLQHGSAAAVKGYETAVAIDAQGHKKSVPSNSANALGNRDDGNPQQPTPGTSRQAQVTHTQDLDSDFVVEMPDFDFLVSSPSDAYRDIADIDLWFADSRLVPRNLSTPPLSHGFSPQAAPATASATGSGALMLPRIPSQPSADPLRSIHTLGAAEQVSQKQRPTSTFNSAGMQYLPPPAVRVESLDRDSSRAGSPALSERSFYSRPPATPGGSEDDLDGYSSWVSSPAASDYSVSSQPPATPGRFYDLEDSSSSWGNYQASSDISVDGLLSPALLPAERSGHGPQRATTSGTGLLLLKRKSSGLGEGASEAKRADRTTPVVDSLRTSTVGEWSDSTSAWGTKAGSTSHALSAENIDVDHLTDSDLLVGFEHLMPPPDTHNVKKTKGQLASTKISQRAGELSVTRDVDVLDKLSSGIDTPDDNIEYLSHSKDVDIDRDRLASSESQVQVEQSMASREAAGATQVIRPGKTVDKQASKIKGRKVTPEDLQRWDDLPTSKQKEIGRVGWLAQNGIREAAVNYLRIGGLSLEGHNFLKRAAGGKFTKVTTDLTEEWHQMTTEQKNQAGGLRGWAYGKNINLRTVKRHLSGGVERGAGEGRKATAEDLLRWSGMSSEEKLAAGGLTKWIKANGLKASSRFFFNSEGLSTIGYNFLDDQNHKMLGIEREGSKITAAQIQAWKDLTPEERKAANGLVGYAKDNGILLGSAFANLSESGVRPKGQNKIDRAQKQRNYMIQLAEEALRGKVSSLTDTTLVEASANPLVTSAGLTPAGEARFAELEFRKTAYKVARNSNNESSTSVLENNTTLQAPLPGQVVLPEPDAQRLFDVLANRREGVGNVEGLANEALDFALQNDLVDKAGNITGAGLSRLNKMNAEKRLLGALTELNKSPFYVQQLGRSAKKAYIIKLSASSGVSEAVLQQYINDLTKVPEMVKILEGKWRDR